MKRLEFYWSLKLAVVANFVRFTHPKHDAVSCSSCMHILITVNILVACMFLTHHDNTNGKLMIFLNRTMSVSSVYLHALSGGGWLLFDSPKHWNHKHARPKRTVIPTAASALHTKTYFVTNYRWSPSHSKTMSMNMGRSRVTNALN